MRLVWMSILASVCLVGAYLVAGGAAYTPAEVRDPCAPREWQPSESLEELGEQLALSGLDGAACSMGVTRESLARALASDQSRQEFTEENGIDADEFDAGVRDGLYRMIDDAEAAGEIGSLVAMGLRAAARVIPAAEALDLLQDARPLIERGIGAAESLDRRGRGVGKALDRGGRDIGEAIDGVRGAVEGLLDSLTTPTTP